MSLSWSSWVGCLKYVFSLRISTDGQGRKEITERRLQIIERSSYCVDFIKDILDLRIEFNNRDDDEPDEEQQEQDQEDQDYGQKSSLPCKVYREHLSSEEDFFQIPS